MIRRRSEVGDEARRSRCQGRKRRANDNSGETNSCSKIMLTLAMVGNKFGSVSHPRRSLSLFVTSFKIKYDAAFNR